MSKLIFDGSAHELSLIDSNGKKIGTWIAYNNVDSHASLTHIENRSYIPSDTIMPHYHAADPNSSYGSYGIIRFNVPGHSGIGIHSGRVNAKHTPGPQHPTKGCIRTTDEAMKTIRDTMSTSPLTEVEVKNNSGGLAKLATLRNQNKNLEHQTRA
jgi:hypothetical protein